MEYSKANRRQKRKDTGLSLAKDCYLMKLDLLTNATVVDDAIRFVNDKINTDVRSKDEQKEVENDLHMTKNEIF
jgi:hypothetical protein